MSLSPNGYIFENGKLRIYKKPVFKYFYSAILSSQKERKPQIRAIQRARRIKILVGLFWQAMFAEDLQIYLRVKLNEIAKLGSILFTFLKINSGLIEAPL